MKTKIIFVLLVTFFLANSNIILVNNIINTRETQLEISPKSSYYYDIAYGEYTNVHGSSDNDDKIDWQFSSSKTNIGITAMAMTYSNYLIFQSSGSFQYSLLSPGNYYAANGAFRPPSSDTWYIVFLNNDSDHQTTTLTYSAVIDTDYYGDSDDDDDTDTGGDTSYSSWTETSGGSLIGMLILVVLPITAIGALVIVPPLLIHKKRKKKKRSSAQITERASLQYLPPSIVSQVPPNVPTQGNLCYCTKCGDKCIKGDSFCKKCGNKL